MVKNKEDLKFYIKEDVKANGDIKPNFIKRILYSEKHLILHYLVSMRKLEFFINNKNSLYARIMILIYKTRFKRAGIKLGFSLPLNNIGPGLTLHHAGSVIVNGSVKIGRNCTLQPGVVIGRTANGAVPTIGNNVYFSPGAMAFGGIHIGDSVIVAPNSNVIKDVESNSVVSGVPAKFLKIRSPDQ